jgi:hypothetical protein
MGRLATKTPIYRYWISLDFLGFSRPKRDLSMGCAGKTKQKNFSPFFLCVRGAATDAAVLAYGPGRIVHGASLILISAFRNKLSPEPFLRPRRFTPGPRGDNCPLGRDLRRSLTPRSLSFPLRAGYSDRRLAITQAFLTNRPVNLRLRERSTAAADYGFAPSRSSDR